MCGIVGILSKYNGMPLYAESLFANMLSFDSIRGPDSTGVFGVTKGGHVDWLKGDTDGYTFTRARNFLDFKNRMRDYQIVIGHNRKATSGAVNPHNAHPFQEKHIILVHNGTLRGTDGLENTEVDSQAIAKALAEHDPVKALSLINGAYALVWFDSNEKTLNLARNSERPLSLIEYDTTWIISSEVGLPLWLQGRENRKTKIGEGITQVPEKKILVFKLDKLDSRPLEVAYEEYKRWSIPSSSTSTTFERWPHNTGPSAPQVPAVLRSSTDGRILNIGTPKPKAKEHELLKAGSTVIVEINDSQRHEGAEVLLGNPVFDGEKDENILARFVLPKGTPWTDYFGAKSEPFLWKAKIICFREILRRPTIFVKDLERFHQIEDAQGTVHNADDVQTAIKQGCTRCKGEVAIKDVGAAIVRKKTDGSWRVICPNCLTTSIKTAEAKLGKPISLVH